MCLLLILTGSIIYLTEVTLYLQRVIIICDPMSYDNTLQGISLTEVQFCRQLIRSPLLNFQLLALLFQSLTILRAIACVCFASDYDDCVSGEYSSHLSAHALAATGITRGMEGCGGVRYYRGAGGGRLSGMTHPASTSIQGYF